MARMKTTSIAYVLVLNIVFFTLSSACDNCYSPKIEPPPPPPQPKQYPPSPPPPQPKPCPPPPQPKPSPPPPNPPNSATCSRDRITFGVCHDLLARLLIGGNIGTPQNTPCYTLVKGLVDLEAAVCLCTAIKANVLGININVSISLSLLLNICSKNIPPGFQCA